jgi:hypothetical protein
MRVHKNQSLVPTLSQMNPIHIVLPYFYIIHCNIVLPSIPRSSKYLFPSGFSEPNFLWISNLSHECYIPRPVHPSWFGHSKNIWWVQIMKPLTMQFPLASCYFLPLRSKKKLLSTLFWITLILYSSLNVTDQVSQNNRQINVTFWGY